MCLFISFGNYYLVRDLFCVSPLMVEIFNTGVEIILGIRVVCFQIKGGFTLSRNCYVGSCVKFSFANKIEVMYERSLVIVKVRTSIAQLHV